MHPGDLAQRHIEALNARDFDSEEAILSDDFTMHHVLYPLPSGRASYRAAIDVLFAAFPDLTVELHDVLSAGDRAVIRYTERGTNTGPLPIIPDGEPTGRAYEKHGIAIYRAADGRLAECWMQEDDLGFMRQLGLIS